MAVEKTKIKERLKALFPKANLSQTRLDAIAAKLSPKPADDADDASIDAVLTAYNEDAAMSFEELAKYDDRMRTLEAKNKDKEGGEGSGTGGDRSNGNQQQQQGTGQEPESEIAKLTKIVTSLAGTVTAMQQEKQIQTITQRFKSETDFKGLDEGIIDAFIPKSEEEYEANKAKLTEIAKRNKLANFGNDTPLSGNGKPGKKEASQEKVNAILKNILPTP